MPAAEDPAPPDVTGIVALVAGLLRDMENRLVAKMDDNSRLASERWEKHDRESEKLVTRIYQKIEAVERDLAEQSVVLHDHLAREHDEDLVMQARVKPITSVAAYIAKNWRSILLIVLASLALFGIASDTLRHILVELGILRP